MIQCVTTFFAAFIVAFSQEWRLTLVMLAYTPLIVVVTMILAKVMHTCIIMYATAEKYYGAIFEYCVKVYMPSLALLGIYTVQPFVY